MHYLLFYDYVADYETRRTPIRGLHLAYARESVERGELLLAGTLAHPVDGAVFLFSGPSAEGAERFARGDPYVKNGLVKHWRVREWNTVIGPGAAHPVQS